MTELWYKPQVTLTPQQIKELTRLLEQVKWKPSTRKGVGKDHESLTFFSGEALEYINNLVKLPVGKDCVLVVTVNRLVAGSHWDKIPPHYDRNNGLT